MSKLSRIAYHVFLTLTLFGMTVGVLYFWLMRNDFLTQNPDIEPFLNYYIASAVLTMAGAICLLKGKHFGFWLMLAGFAGALSIEILSDFPWEKMIRIPVAGLILFGLMRWNKLI